MNNDTIGRQDAIDAICYEWCYATYDSCPHRDEEDYMCDGCDDIKIIESLPSADRTGVWVDENGRPYKGKPNNSCWCGKCGEWLVASDEYNVSTSYCPNCGVRMLNGGE